jgi:hypothetical protein
MILLYPERRLTRGTYIETLIDLHRFATAQPSAMDLRFATSEVGLYTCIDEFGSQLNTR